MVSVPVGMSNNQTEQYGTKKKLFANITPVTFANNFLC